MLRYHEFPSKPSAPHRGMRRTAAAVLLALALLMAARPLAAQTEENGRLVLRSADVWDFAEDLYGQGEYYRAISEYKRLLHFFPRAPQDDAARLRIAEAYLNGGEPAEGARYLTGLLADAPPPPVAKLRFLRAVARLELDAGLPYPLREGHIRAALDDLHAVRGDAALERRAQGFATALEQPPELPGKSPWLAAGLSAVLPGAGSAYVGRYREAALAFFVNAVFIYAAVNAFENDREGLGAVLGTAALAFYGGAIYAAANGAHKYNSDVRSGYLAHQRARFGLLPRPEGVAGIVELRF